MTTGSVDELCQKYCVEAKVMAVRRCRKIDLKRIAKATGAQLLLSLANMEGDESFDSSMLGDAEEVVQERIADDELILIRGYFSRHQLNYHLVIIFIDLFFSYCSRE